MDKLKERRLFNKWDLWLLTGLALPAICAYLWLAWADDPQNMRYAQIVINGRISERVDLSVDRTFYLGPLPNVRFQVRDGAIAFIESDCPDQICVRSGFINRPGQMAICLPNRCSLSILAAVGSEDEILDTVTQ